MNRHSGKPGGLLLCSLLALLMPALCVAADHEEAGEGSFLIWRYGQCEIGDRSALEEAFRAYLVRQPSDPAKTARWIAAEEEISRILGPAVASPAELSTAWEKFQKLSMDPMDRGGCRDLAAMMTRASGILARKRRAPTAEETELNRQKEILTWNVSLEQRRQQELLASQGRPKKGSGKRPPPSESSLKLEKVVAEISRRKLAAESEENQVRLEFQELAMRFLRRGDYREAILAVRFYKAIFGALIVPLRLGKDSAEVLMPEGTTPTLQDLENIARRSIETMGHGLAESTLLLKDDLLSAGTAKLAGIFAMGGGMPEVRAFPADLRAQVATFLNLQNDLRKHLADGDHTKASSDLDRIEKLARDFDSASLRSTIAAAKASARILLPKPVIAVQGGDLGGSGPTNTPVADAASTNAPATNPTSTNPIATNTALTNEVRADAPMTNVLPTNDAVTNVPTARPENAAEDFDMLLASGKAGEIVARQAFFEEALGGFPERLAVLNETVSGETAIRECLDHAAKLRDSGAVIEAWEEAEALSLKHPGHPAISQFQTTLHPSSEAFENGINKARSSEKDRPVDALNAYLRLRSLYPSSRLAEEGVQRMSLRVLGKR